MNLSLIVAFDKNRLIGSNNQLPWRLPADLKYFKSLTMGHHLSMGRKTYDSIGKALPGRISVVVTRQKNLSLPDCIVVNSLDEAIEICKKENEVFVIGGAELFYATLKIASRLYITEIDHTFEGDTWFPEIDAMTWSETSRESHPADEKNLWPYTFVIYDRK